MTAKTGGTTVIGGTTDANAVDGSTIDATNAVDLRLGEIGTTEIGRGIEEVDLEVPEEEAEHTETAGTTRGETGATIEEKSTTVTIVKTETATTTQVDLNVRGRPYLHLELQSLLQLSNQNLRLLLRLVQNPEKKSTRWTLSMTTTQL